MAMTLEEVGTLLETEGIRFEQKGLSRLLLGSGTRRYRSPEGYEGVFLIIELAEDGEYFKLFAPKAYQAVGPHVDAFLQSCMVIQWRTKLVQFEYDPSDGEIRPIIEFPLEDNKLTAKQLLRCIIGLVQIVDEYYEPLKRALDDGVAYKGPSQDEALELLARMATHQQNNQESS